MDSTTRIVEREGERAALTAFVDALSDGPSGLVLDGDAGIGKTTIWLAGMELAASRGFQVLRARPVATETKLSFAGLGDLLVDIREWPERLPGAQQAALDGALLRADRPVNDPRAVALAVSNLLRILSEDQPLVVGVDDVQWLDAATRRVLEFIIRRVGTARVGFMVTRRSDRRDAGGDILCLERALDARSLRLRVGPLGSEGIAQLLRERLMLEAGRGVVLQIALTSGGNPLHALELGRELPDLHALAPGEALPLPDTLRDVVRLRLVQLPALTREALLVIALLARTRTDVVARALGHEESSLEVAFHSGLVERDGDEVRFTHPLLASVLVSDATPGERQAVHRRLADVVADSEERAWHLGLGAEGADPEAVVALEDAALAARLRGAPEVAAEMLVLAAMLMPTTAVDERRALTFAAATDFFNAGDSQRSRRMLEYLVADTGPGRARARILGMLATVRFNSDNARVALTLTEQALDEAEGDSGLQLELHLTRAVALTITGDGRSALQHVAIARSIAEDLGVIEAEQAANAIEVMMRDPLEFAPAGHMPEADLGGSITESPIPGGPHFVEGNRLLWHGDLEGARRALETALVAARGAGDEGSLSLIHQLLARLECWAGDLPRARVCGEAAATMAASIGRDVLRAVALSVLAPVHALAGDAAATYEVVNEGLALSEQSGQASTLPELEWARGCLKLSLGEMEAAAADLERASEGMRAMGFDNPARFRYALDEVEALVAVGRLGDAETCAEQIPSAGRAGRVAWVRAARARALGLIAAARGDTEASLHQLGVAIELHAGLPMPADHARTLLIDGRVRRRAKQWGSARRSLTEALSIFEAIGATLWAEQARSELGRVGGRQPSGDGLSTTELRVAELVATGRTNREAADALFLSQKTVEWYLSRIYRKLGIRNRTELGPRLGGAKSPL